MAVSEQTIRELVATLGELGAFRDVRVWRCDTNDTLHADLRLGAERAGAGTMHDPAELIDPRGRREPVAKAQLDPTAGDIVLGRRVVYGRSQHSRRHPDAPVPGMRIRPYPIRLVNWLVSK